VTRRPEDISAILPHRYPFLLVDRVVEAEPGVRAVAELEVTADMPFVSVQEEGTFPDVLVLEAMAQVGAVAAAGYGGEDVSPGNGPGIRGYLAAISDASFKGRLRPGDVLRIEMRYLARMGPMVKFTGSASVGGEEIVSCGLTFTVEV